MRLGTFTLALLKRYVEHGIRKRKKQYPLDNDFKAILNSRYDTDGSKYHTFDVFYANERRKNICVFDFHGGAYVLGDKRDSYMLGQNFVKNGFDFVAAEYTPNNGKNHTYKIFDDIVKCLLYVYHHREDFGLECDQLVLTGDSAGGHIALFLAMMIEDKNLAAKMGYDFEDIKVSAVLLNCPVYNFPNLARDMLSKSGLKYLFGPDYDNNELNKLISPKEYIKNFNVPVFLSTCKLDFIRSHSLELFEDLKKYNKVFEFIDIDDVRVGHVHNVISPYKSASKLVNSKMIEFIKTHVK